MGFIIAKTMLLLALPLSSLLVSAGAGILLARRYPRTGKAVLVTALFIIYTLSLSPVANAVLRPLETEYEPLSHKLSEDVDYILVLSGGAKDLSWLELSPAPSGSSLERLVYGISLYKIFPGTKLFFSGGSGDPARPEMNEAEAMKRTALSLGVPPDDIVIEGKSRNTLENVEFLKDELSGKKVVLVTSAFHMGRSVAMFRNAGIDVFPAPTAHASEDVNFSFFSLIPDVGSLGKSSTAFYEYLSRFWYRINGAI